ncbi:hypothetical protein ACTXT7_014838 [Hymenolepis weldensis]
MALASGFNYRWPTPGERNPLPHWLIPDYIEGGRIRVSHQRGSRCYSLLKMGVREGFPKYKKTTKLEDFKSYRQYHFYAIQVAIIDTSKSTNTKNWPRQFQAISKQVVGETEDNSSVANPKISIPTNT